MSPENPSSIEDVESVNDRLATNYSIDDYYARSPLPIRLIEKTRLKAIREFVGEDRGLKIAEVGSGGGHVLGMFKNAKLTAIDVSGKYLDIAKRNLQGYDVEFIKGEVNEMDPLPSGFDRVICTEVLEHTRDPRAVLGAIKRMLAPGGRAVITVPNDPLIIQLKRAVRITPVGWVLRNRIQWGGDEMHLHRWTPSQFRALLNEQFRVLEERLAPSRVMPIRACYLCEPKA